MESQSTPPISNKVFRKETIFLDGARYYKCTFIGCKMVYRGTDGFSLPNCTISGCTWHLDEPASNALVLLATLYAMGPDGRRIVEETFDDIRSGGALSKGYNIHV